VVEHFKWTPDAQLAVSQEKWTHRKRGRALRKKLQRSWQVGYKLLLQAKRIRCAGGEVGIKAVKSKELFNHITKFPDGRHKRSVLRAVGKSGAPDDARKDNVTTGKRSKPNKA